jgi:DNA-binding HxlR family transcriptional regulator
MVTDTTYETMEMPQEGTGMRPGHTHVTEDCRAMSEVLQRIGDKWSILVVSRLGKGPLRFSELRNFVGGISQKMLTTTLRSLERDGFVTRTAFATIPPRVDYELTDLGRELLVPVDALSEWTRKNLARIDMARAEFDRRCAGTCEGRDEAGQPS